ncbi:MAG: NADH-quinone oxidoreductase subunit NuoH [Anaerolineae bacterium]|jgi:NADH-quinone oxidoreductase subunit H|nr:NADH-quinone oxidoreductase subunit NuoH [Anaerolineae bacterium]
MESRSTPNQFLRLGITLVILAVIGGGLIALLNGITGQACLNNLSSCLTNNGWNPGIAGFVPILLGVLGVATFPLLVTILLIWVERKFAARIQDRIGPNRVGPFGLIQPLADVLKLLTKEDITPTGADKPIYNLAPPFMVASVLLIWAVVPFTPYHYGVDLEIGAIYFVAVASIATLAVIMGGWASNNKYALLGAFRTVALLVSYEIPLAMALLVPVLLAGSMSMVGIVEAQGAMWFMFMAPIATLLFFISSQAEVGRAPFDLIEAESELIAGFNIEYSGMKFAMFFAGEFMHVFTNGVLMAILFTGGWWGPFAYEAPLLGFFYLMIKSSFWYFISLWVRNSLPRFRVDQVMNLNWKILVPISILNLIMMALMLRIALGFEQSAGIVVTDFFSALPRTGFLLIGNVVVLVVVWLWLGRQGRQQRQLEEMNRFSVTATGD